QSSLSNPFSTFRFPPSVSLLQSHPGSLFRSASSLRSPLKPHRSSPGALLLRPWQSVHVRSSKVRPLFPLPVPMASFADHAHVRSHRGSSDPWRFCPLTFPRDRLPGPPLNRGSLSNRPLI